MTIAAAPLAWTAVAVVGALILSRHPGHLAGRLFLVAGVAAPLAVAADAYAVLGLYAEPGSLPAARHVGTLIAAWFLGPPLVAGALLALIPDGRPRSRGWGLAAAAAIAGLLLHAAGIAFGDGQEDFPGVANPYRIGELGRLLEPAVLALPLGAVVGVAALWAPPAARSPNAAACPPWPWWRCCRSWPSPSAWRSGLTARFTSSSSRGSPSRSAAWP